MNTLALFQSQPIMYKCLREHVALLSVSLYFAKCGIFSLEPTVVLRVFRGQYAHALLPMVYAWAFRSSFEYTYISVWFCLLLRSLRQTGWLVLYYIAPVKDSLVAIVKIISCIIRGKFHTRAATATGVLDIGLFNVNVLTL